MVFISKDCDLREAAIARFDAKALAAYEEVTNFSSFLKLTREKIDQEFLQVVLQKVPSIFYTSNDPECVYNKFKVGERIIQRFPVFLDFLHEKQQSLFMTRSGMPSGFYSPISEEKFFIDSTRLNSAACWQTEPGNGKRVFVRCACLRSNSLNHCMA